MPEHFPYFHVEFGADGAGPGLPAPLAKNAAADAVGCCARKRVTGP